MVTITQPSNDLKCDFCPRILNSKTGKANHQRACMKTDRSKSEAVATSKTTVETDVTHEQLPQSQSPQDLVEPDPPPDKPVDEILAQPAYKWNDIPARDFEEAVKVAYEKIVYWRKNVFL
eukprot:TCONS_00052431-protein